MSGMRWSQKLALATLVLAPGCVQISDREAPAALECPVLGEETTLTFERSGEARLDNRLVALTRAREPRRFGIEVAETNMLPEEMRPRHAAPGGVVVSRLLDTSPFALAGLEPMDAILEVDSKPVTSAAEVVSALEAAPDGVAVHLLVRKPRIASAEELRAKGRVPLPEETLAIEATANGPLADTLGVGLGVFFTSSSPHGSGSFEVEKLVEKRVEVKVPFEVEKIVEKRVEVPVRVEVERRVEVEKIVVKEVRVEVPVRVDGPQSPSPLAVADVHSVERWDPSARRWVALESQASLPAGSVVRGQGQASLAVGSRRVRLSSGLYVVSERRTLEAVPEGELAQAPATAPRSSSANADASASQPASDASVPALLALRATGLPEEQSQAQRDLEVVYARIKDPGPSVFTSLANFVSGDRSAPRGAPTTAEGWRAWWARVGNQ